MNCRAVASDHTPHPRFLIYRTASLIRLVWCCTICCSMLAQNPSGPTSATSSAIGATHVLGLEGTSKNAKGKLSIQDKVVQFQKSGSSAVQLDIGSIQDVLLGEQDKQVGGLPMTLGKAATPYGGGRVISLFAHKKYDTFTLEYLDANGGFHGAVFLLNQGQGQVLRNELVAKGAHVTQTEDPAKHGTPEVKNESK
jgi:hypothetical protein